MVYSIAIWIVVVILFVVVPVVIGAIASCCKRQPFFSVNTGIWVWGSLMAVIGCTATAVLISSAIYINLISGVMHTFPRPYLLPSLYIVLKDLGTLCVIVGLVVWLGCIFSLPSLHIERAYVKHWSKFNC